MKYISHHARPIFRLNLRMLMQVQPFASNDGVNPYLNNTHFVVSICAKLQQYLRKDE